MDKEFNEAYENEEYQRIMGTASKPFRRFLDHDEIEQCKRIAIWKFVKKFDPNKSKFTTFLTLLTTRECIRSFRREHRFRSRHTLATYFSGEYIQDYYTNLEVDNILSILSEDEKLILQRKFVDGLSFTELGDEYNMSRQGACQKVQGIVAKLLEASL